MIVHGKVVAKIQQAEDASFARIQVYKNKKNAAALMRIFDIFDSGELNIGDVVLVSVMRAPAEQQPSDVKEELPGFARTEHTVVAYKQLEQSLPLVEEVAQNTHLSLMLNHTVVDELKQAIADARRQYE